MIRSLLCALLLVGSAFGQFEVASIKPHPPGDTDGHIGPHPGGFEAVGIPLKVLIQVAWHLKEYQISGGPDWINADHYDVLAKAPAGVNPTPQQLMPMLQALLVERFQLKVHHETKEMPALALVLAKGGPKLKPAAGDPSRISVGNGYLKGMSLSLPGLADALSMDSDRAIVDKTGLSGDYDLELKWTPGMSDAGTPLVTAIQEQLGLKLESTKAPVDILVIDSAQKATEN